MSNISSHPALIYAADFADICRPLQNLKINYFAHAQIDKQQQLSAMSSHPQFFQLYLEKRYYNVDLHMAEFGLTNDYYVWDMTERRGLSAKMNEDAIAFNARHPFSIIQKNKDSVDYFHFA